MAEQAVPDTESTSATSLFPLVKLSGKGYRLVTNQDIKRGTRIIEGSAIIHLEPVDSEIELCKALVREISQVSAEKV